MVRWLARTERDRLALSDRAARAPELPRKYGIFRARRGGDGSAFTFDSSRHLNCHSNFLRKIALVRTVRGDRTTGMQPGHGDDVAAGKKEEAEMADIGLGGGQRAEPSNADECFALGMIHSAGAGVAVDLVQAHKWFNIAAVRGHGDAARLRREIAEQMSDGEIGSAQRAARDWLHARVQPAAAICETRIAA
jgi:TPR repeat protein